MSTLDPIGIQGGIQGGELLPQVVWDDFLGSAESRRASGLRGFAAGGGGENDGR